jgi:hypothetical protein
MTPQEIEKLNNDYKAAIRLIRQITDDEYRQEASNAVIALRVRRELGYDHPSGDLAMRLRKEAA